MTILNFVTRPGENKTFLPAIAGFVREQHATPIRVDGVFDVLITDTRDAVDKYLELKVRLASAKAKGALPLSPKQWRFLTSFPSAVEPRFRVLIYDHAAQKYCLCSVDALRPAIRKTEPKSTWYMSRKFLKTLPWLEPADAFTALASWVHGDR